jgi:hypothetical protein
VRTIRLGHDGEVSLGAYVAAVKKVDPARTYDRGLTGWWPVTGAEVLEQFRAGVHDRINCHDPAYGKGRKWDPDWQAWTWRAARALNTPRLRVYASEIPGWLRARVAHRLADRDG